MRKFAKSAALCMGLMLLQSCGGSSFTRNYVDQYVEYECAAKGQQLAMAPGVAVYVDFSDGMNAAYNQPTSKEALKKAVNVLTDRDNKTSFFTLANNQITPLELTQTDIYNAIISGKFNKPGAPIEQTLKEIVEKKQPALFITDFEEYTNGKIQQQGYAKSYFIDWLTMGFNITFYKVDYKEGGKDKHLYYTIFDSPEGNPYLDKTKDALNKFLGQGMERFVIGGADCIYPMATDYLSSTQGGNYHNANGEDIVTAVLEGGKKEDFCSYPLAADGHLYQYYPLGEEWQRIPENIAAMREEGIDNGDRFKHLLANLYIDFGVQNGYTIDGVCALAYNFQAMPDSMAAMEEERKPADVFKNLAEPKEVADMFVASLAEPKNEALAKQGWKEVTVDFDPRFKGTLPSSMATPQDLLKVDVVISNAKMASDEEIDAFFGWAGNMSLAESVRNTLGDSAVNPTGRTIVTYFLKTL